MTCIKFLITTQDDKVAPALQAARDQLEKSQMHVGTQV